MLHEKSDYDFKRGTFRVKGDVLEIIPANERTSEIRIEFFDDEIEQISTVDTLTGKVLKNKKTVSIFPANHFTTSENKLKEAIKNNQN